MLSSADREMLEVVRFFSIRGLEAGYLVPTETGLAKSIMDAHGQLAAYLRRSCLHDYSLQPKGPESKVQVRTWLVKEDALVETKSSLYRPETNGDPRIWIYDLSKHANAGNLLAIFAHENDLYVVNTSMPGLLESASISSSPFSRVLDLLAAAKNKPLDDKFTEWNLRLLRSFFSEASKGEEVFLRIDKGFLDQIGQDIGGDAGFLDALRVGPTWKNQRRGFVQQILDLVSQRNTSIRLRIDSYKDPGDFDTTYRNVSAPTYLPYLAALVRNDAERDGAAYYEALKADIDLNGAFGSNEMAQLEPVWADLQNWTNQVNGRFGKFRFRTLGGYSRIGVPRSQSILQQGDIEYLSVVFVQSEIRPGQELSDKQITRIFNEAKVSHRLFSAPFQSALVNEVFEQPIRAAINAAYVDWDGTLPKKTDNIRSFDSSQSASTAPEGDIGLCLSLIQHEPLQLAPLWRLPAIQDSGRFELKYEELKWKGSFVDTEGATCELSPKNSDTVWKIAEKAYDQAIQLDLHCFGNEDDEATKISISLPMRQLWILVPSFDGANGGIELRQGDLPASGQAYLLASPKNVGRLQNYLNREKPKHNLITAIGLPDDWLLVCLVECSGLKDEQRMLPDGADTAHPKPRPIRFIGGRSIRRGYSRMYLPYDLPSIELDALDGVSITSSDGLKIEELQYGQASTLIGSTVLKPLRRFRLRLPHSNSALYRILAMQGGSILGHATLRIAGQGGDVVETGQPFSLDSMGRPMASNEGLSGVLHISALDENFSALTQEELFNLSASDIGSSARYALHEPGTREMFLDALAQSGGFDVGVARELIKRLLLSTGESGEPLLMLLELRSLGNLEISTTHKGHISRIHPVEPALYELPVRYQSKPVYGVAGTLRLSHWELIAREREAWSAYRSDNVSATHQAWRLVAENVEMVESVCRRAGFRHVVHPSVSIAAWSADLEIVRSESFRNPMESIGSAQEGAVRFNASRGRFTAKAANCKYELWKVRDLDLGIDNLYVLADQGKFSYIRDSRWGVWAAIDAFALFVSTFPNMAGVHPVPITYAKKDGTLWLPARISLPCVLERALILCGGDTPEVNMLQESENIDSSIRIPLSMKAGERPLFTANRFYGDMAKGRWLAYRWVPEPVARVVARKLGAALDIV